MIPERNILSPPRDGQRMGALAARFAERLPAKLDALDAQYSALPSLCSPDELTGLRRALHDFVGTAPVLGFADLGDAARAAETVVTAIQRRGEPLDESDRSALRRSLDQVCAAARRSALG